MLSGGVDSSALASIHKPDIAITVNYGQKPFAGELRAARVISRILGIELIQINANCEALGSGDLAGSSPVDIAPIPEWWPFRNQLIATIAASWCVSNGISKLQLGSIRGDSQHKDGTKEFYEKLCSLTMMQEGNLRVECPGIDLTCEEVVKKSGKGLEYFSWTHSCHKGEWACGWCRGCTKRANVLSEVFDVPN